MRIIANRFATKCSETKKKIEYGDVCLYNPILKCVYHLESIMYLNYKHKYGIS